jgi:hypothetical protein
MPKRIVPEEPTEYIHPQDIYTPEAHERNLSTIRGALAIFGTATEEGIILTPWLKSPKGLAMTEDNDSHYKVQAVEIREAGFYGLPTHFIKHIIKMDENGIDTKTESKIYMRIRQHLGILVNYPISAGMMLGYPTVGYSPRATTEVIDNHLGDSESLVPATRQMLSGLFIARSKVLKHWVGVKLPEE